MRDLTLYPAIDIRGGKCVRLKQGDYNQETVYGDSPLAMARTFSDAGATWIHTVDLDGAKAGKPVNEAAIAEIKKHLSVGVHVGGGIRSPEAVARYLQAGVDRVILGSSAISDPEFTKDMLKRYGSQIVIGIDVRDGYAAVEGWTKTSKIKAGTLALELAGYGAEMFIFTDISRDGMLAGPNITAITDFARAVGKPVIASGGVSRLDDIQTLAGQEQVAGAIIGKALYTGAVTMADALKAGVR